MDNPKDYPVMLYLGGLDSHAIAHDEDEADALKAKGYVEHDEAVKIEPKLDGSDRVGSKLPNDKDDQLAEAYEHIELLEGAIEVKDKEITDLKESNAELEMALSGRNMALEGKNELIAELEAELAIYKSSKDVNGDGVVSYDEMTNAELQKLLEQRKVDYNKRDGKDALIKAAKDSE